MNIVNGEKQFSKRCLSLGQLTRIRRVLVSVVAVVMLGFVVGAMSILASPGTAEANDYLLFFVAMFLACAGCVSMLNFGWLPDHRCDALASLCERHPSLMAYRDKVVAAGRRFTVGEEDAMKCWAEDRENEMRETLDAVAVAERRREGRQRLYGATPVSQV
jgi:hypothetical protein